MESFGESAAPLGSTENVEYEEVRDEGNEPTIEMVDTALGPQPARDADGNKLVYFEDGTAMRADQLPPRTDPYWY